MKKPSMGRKSPFAHLSSLARRAEDNVEAPEKQNDRPAQGNKEEGGEDFDLGEGNTQIPTTPANALETGSEGEGEERKEEDDEEEDRLDEENKAADEKDEEVLKKAEDVGDDKELDDRADAAERERDRCASIFRCRAAALNPELAAQLAFGTNLSRTQAVAVLRAGASGSSQRNGKTARRNAFGRGASSYGSLRNRMSKENITPSFSPSQAAQTGSSAQDQLMKYMLHSARKDGLA